MTRFIAIASAKGGTGKTTTAINLATLFNDAGKDTILIDADLTAPNISHYLGFPEVSITLHDVLLGKQPTLKAIYLHPSGFKLMPASHSSSPVQNFQRKFGSVLIDLVGKTELAIIDSAATLGKETLQALKPADEAIIVTNPELPSVLDAKKTIKIAEDFGLIVPGIVVNRARKDRHELSAEKIKSILQKPLIGIIPEDNNIRKSLMMKQPMVHTHPYSPASKGFKQLADMLK